MILYSWLLRIAKMGDEVMKIIILDMLISQYENREVATASLKRINKELRNLATLVDQGRQAVVDYLVKGNDGKPFHGIRNGACIYKYDLTDGDRSLYVHGSDLWYLREEDRDSYVLVSYAPHDLQERIARRGHFFQKHDYEDVKSYVGVVVEGEDLTEKERLDIAVGFFGNFKAYEIDVDELETLTASELDKRVLLTPDQRKYFEEWAMYPAPTLITGGAGTGKTIMAIRMLESFDMSRQNAFAIYFTQSQELRKKGKKQFCSLLNIENQDVEGTELETSNQNVIGFFNINDYCIKQLELGRFAYVRFQEFEKEFCAQYAEVAHMCRKAGLSFFDVWIDIRGVIKGSLNEHWQRRMSVSQFDYSARAVEALVNRGLLSRMPSNPQRLKLPWSTIEAKKQLASLSGDVHRAYEQIISAFETIDTSMHMIALDDYLSVSDEISLFTSEQRRCVYQICEMYQKWLDASRKMDENDLVMAVLTDTQLEQYDFVVVDEVQDYTELQLFLIHQLCDKKEMFVFAGDIHQVINPTVFNHERLEKLFLSDTGDDSLLRVRPLNSNYRCQQGIVNAANRLSALRRKIVGRKDAVFEEEEHAHDPMVISSPFRVVYSATNLKAMLLEIMRYPRIGVLVADEEARTRLIDCIGEQVYQEYDVPFIFTISEIKGMEYQYIVCVDMFTHYNQEWQSILADDMAKKKETKHRFCFNLAYVALTRAQLHICFMDQTPVPQIDEVMGLHALEAFDAEECHFTDLGNSLEDWYEQARIHRENGNYSAAIKYYQKSGDYAKPEDFYACYIGDAEAKRDYVRLIQYALLNQNFSLANQYVDDPAVPASIKELVVWFSSPVKKSGIVALIDDSFKEFSQQERDRIYLMAKQKLREEAVDVLGLSICAGGM